MNKLYVVGIGPGQYEQMTIAAADALSCSDIIVGYQIYVELIKEHFPEKEFITTPMRQEVQRCRIALQKAADGNNVAMVCSGDAGIYGMTGLLYELSAEYPEVEIVPIGGITAAVSGAALLGAPLTNDFCVISLSDLLTPYEIIEKRLDLAARADFVIVIYNPSSKKRHDYLQKACEIIMRSRPADTVCGIAKNIGREGQSCELMDLETLSHTHTDMFTTVFIGNSHTKLAGDRMVTQRGYEI